MKYLILIWALIGLSGCATGASNFTAEEGWVIENRNFLFFNWVEKVYCRAHKSADGRNVDPKCYKAEEMAKGTRYLP